MKLVLTVIKRPGEAPFAAWVPNRLKDLQDLVGGYIEMIGIDRNTAVLCNEEGLLLGMPRNITIKAARGLYTLVGTVVGVGARGDRMVSLTEEQKERLMEVLAE